MRHGLQEVVHEDDGRGRLPRAHQHDRGVRRGDRRAASFLRHQRLQHRRQHLRPGLHGGVPPLQHRRRWDGLPPLQHRGLVGGVWSTRQGVLHLRRVRVDVPHLRADAGADPSAHPRADRAERPCGAGRPVPLRRERPLEHLHVVHDEAILKEHLNHPAGLLVLLPHMGNWELFNVFFRRYGQMTALYQPPRQGYMQKVMQEVRARHGNHMVPTTRSGLKQLYKTLGDGGTAVILPDQVPASGQFIPFFGHPALTDVLASRLLKKTGAKALGIAMVRNEGGFFEAHVVAPDSAIYALDVVTAITAVNELVQTCAEIAPKQYQWEYKRFRERPAGSEKIYRFNKPSGHH